MADKGGANTVVLIQWRERWEKKERGSINVTA